MNTPGTFSAESRISKAAASPMKPSRFSLTNYVCASYILNIHFFYIRYFFSRSLRQSVLVQPINAACLRIYIPRTLSAYAAGSLISKAAASPFRGSVGLGYSNSWGRNTSNTLIKSVQVRVSVTNTKDAKMYAIYSEKCQFNLARILISIRTIGRLKGPWG